MSIRTLTELTLPGLPVTFKSPRIASEFDSTVNYSQGDICTKNGVLYKFISNHVAGPWNSSHVSEITIGGEVSNLGSAIEVLEPTATSEDVGKTLIAKTVANGKVSEYEFGTAGEGLTEEAKVALLNCFRHVAWIDEHGQEYYDALESALYSWQYPKITAVFNPGLNVIYTDDTLESLKQYLVVKYFETRESTGTVIASSDYNLTGTLVEGTSSVLVSYNNLTTSFVIDNVVDFYNIWRWEWNNSTGNITKVIGQVNSDQSDTAMYPSKMAIDLGNSARRTLCTTRGVAPLYIQNQTAIASSYYPIPIPDTANYMNINIEPAGMYIYMVFHELNESMQYIPRLGRETWRQIPSDGWGRALALSSNNRHRYMCINIKYNDAGTSFPVDPTKIIVEYSEV